MAATTITFLFAGWFFYPRVEPHVRRLVGEALFDRYIAPALANTNTSAWKAGSALASITRAAAGAVLRARRPPTPADCESRRLQHAEEAETDADAELEAAVQAELAVVEAMEAQEARRKAAPTLAQLKEQAARRITT